MSDTGLRLVRVDRVVQSWGPRKRRVMILVAEDGGLHLPISIRLAESDAIDFALVGFELERPMTLDLLASVIETTDAEVEQVVVSRLERDTFFAEVTLRCGGQQRIVDSRPSDAIALALRANALIYMAEDLLKRTGFPEIAFAGTVGRTDRPHQPVVVRTETATSEDEQFDLAIDGRVMQRLGIEVGDRVTGRAVIGLPQEPHDRASTIETVNGQVPGVVHDLTDQGVPISLTVPSDWIQRWPRNFMPLGVTPGALGISVRSEETEELGAEELLARLVQERGGADILLEEEDPFVLPQDFQATILTRTTRRVVHAREAGTGVPRWTTLEGTTTRWIAAVRDGHAVVVALEALDWSRARPVERLLSEVRLVRTATDPVSLTARELDVLRLIVEGATNPAIAEKLDISPHTVANHVANILRKLEAANRTEAASSAVSRGLLDQPPRN